MAQLPEPSPEARAHCAAVKAEIAARIAADSGWWSFHAYQDFVLHAPGLGYYSAGACNTKS